MANMMMYAIVIIAFVAVNYVSSQTYTSCENNMPKVAASPESVKVLVDSGPTKYDIATPSFRCGTKLFAYPIKGFHYDGSAVLIKGNTVTVWDFTVNSDNKTLNSTLCPTDVHQNWYLGQLIQNSDGISYCFYNCKGEAINDFGCASNNKTAFFEQEKKFVDLLKNVSGYSQIQPSPNSCYQNEGCLY
ncbi:hypothetical protein CHUAL_005135 [Chamberlinius hualienensis]